LGKWAAMFMEVMMRAAERWGCVSYVAKVPLRQGCAEAREAREGYGTFMSLPASTDRTDVRWRCDHVVVSSQVRIRVCRREILPYQRGSGVLKV